MAIIMDQDQKQYEIVFILPPQLEGEGLENAKKEIEETINKFEGKIEFKESEKKDLAYPINKQGQGIFIISQLSILPDNINNLSKELKLNKQVLRHLISQMPVIKPETKKPLSRRTQPTEPHLVKLKRKEKPKVGEKTDLKEIDKKLDEIIEEI